MTTLTESRSSLPRPSHQLELEEPPDTVEFVNQQLEPIDHGPAAWKLLGTAFVFESLLWGFPLSFGVFQNYYSELPEFAGNPYISVVGTVASGISYLGAPLTAPFIKRFQKYQRQMIWVGWPICILALISGSFASTLETLILTQGVAYGLGFLIFYYPILNMVNEYWVARRGMAYGLLCSASGVSGAVMPFIMENLLNKYGYRTTLRAVAIALVILTGPLIPFLKGRLPASRYTSTANAAADWSFLRTPVFWVYSVSNVAQGLGYFFPSLYLPSYARSMGLSSTKGAMLLALMSVSQVAGQFTFGFLSDRRVSVNILIALSTVVAAVASFTLWGLARSIAPLIAFALLYGFFGAGYVSMWAKMASSVTADPTATSMVFSLLCFGKGIGNVLTGPLSAGLISRVVALEKYGLAKYMSVVAFTGGCMAFSGVVVCSWYIGKRGMSLVR
ncbi:major facilitator superfamily domain-containing protein [Penicillium paradoxum]|uniref:major facilitator superfamily domain-containing protein n=1 Tax=Penicillium paradoxum TaxID=176176 RepID=UPI002548AD9A|nr:major facilitator superfamily domain-containing protein [Penicillium paradoxum]KAJ5793951.1 major facilitator superfamily domain-containing protein [Penicillium paradoxum]